MKEKTIIETDVLVIGGGLAGTFAAMEARKAGASVILTDKGYVGSTGQSAYIIGFLCYDPVVDNKELWLENIRHHGDYLVNMDWAEKLLDMSKGCVDDLVSFGVAFKRNPDGSLFRVEEDQPDVCSPVEVSNGNCIELVRNAVLKSGTKIMDRTMMTELLMSNGKVCGAIGMSVSGAEPIVIKAKAVVMATGGSALKPPGWPISQLTGDGDMMAYRLGAPITGKEFIDCHGTKADNPSYLAMNSLKGMHGPPGGAPGKDGPPDGAPGKNGPPGGGAPAKGGPGSGPMILQNALGESISCPPHLNLGAEFEIHAGRGPMKSPGAPRISCASSGLSAHKTEGIWAEGLDASTALPGLYAAGDCLGCMMTGAAYSALGLASCGSAVTGKVAGESAAKYGATTQLLTAPEDVVEELFTNMYAPLYRHAGFKPNWLITLLQNTMMPYYVLIIKHEERLNATLSQVRFMKNHIVPKLYAENDHELRLVIEVKNMVMNAELKLISALARKESRGTHFREDYPNRDEAGMQAWLTVQLKDGEPTVNRIEMPAEWCWHEGDARLVQLPPNF